MRNGEDNRIYILLYLHYYSNKKVRGRRIRGYLYSTLFTLLPYLYWIGLFFSIIYILLYLHYYIKNSHNQIYFCSRFIFYFIYITTLSVALPKTTINYLYSTLFTLLRKNKSDTTCTLLFIYILLYLHYYVTYHKSSVSAFSFIFYFIYITTCLKKKEKNIKL